MSVKGEYKNLVERANAIGYNVFVILTNTDIQEYGERWEASGGYPLPLRVPESIGSGDLDAVLDDLDLAVEFSERFPLR